MKKPVDELELNDGRKKLLKKRKEREMKRMSSGNGSGIKMTKYATAKKPVDEFELHASYQKHLKKKRKEGERKKRMEAEFVPDIPETFVGHKKMSSSRNAIRRRVYKERAQPHSRRKFGLLEKHKDYVERARVYHQKEKTLQKLKEKAAFRNPDEFNFKMIKSKCVNGVHRPRNESTKNKEKLASVKTQKWHTERKKTQKFDEVLYSLGSQSSSKHGSYATDREWEARQDRVEDLEIMHMNMPMQTELKKKGKKRKLGEDEFEDKFVPRVYI